MFFGSLERLPISSSHPRSARSTLPRLSNTGRFMRLPAPSCLLGRSARVPASRPIEGEAQRFEVFGNSAPDSVPGLPCLLRPSSEPPVARLACGFLPLNSSDSPLVSGFPNVLRERATAPRIEVHSAHHPLEAPPELRTSALLVVESTMVS